MTGKIDLVKTRDGYRARRGEFRIVELADAAYLAIDGHGDPNTSSDYADAVSSLYPVAYTLKFFSKRELDRDYVVPPLEGLWWADDMDAFTRVRDKSRWSWTMMILVPEWLSPDAVQTAISQAGKKNPPARLAEVRLRTLAEGLCVQTLHVGPFDDEAPVLERLHHEFLPRQGLRMTGHHHEIYLSDPRRSAPERLRTILRQPVARIAPAR